ncbi:MAG TPA: PDZ domain-containing protein [Verrucomicrobiales bacterium]|nr:PDZ domain-containing protein [Verrucomicrobiales bacterium]
MKARRMNREITPDGLLAPTLLRAVLTAAASLWLGVSGLSSQEDDRRRAPGQDFRDMLEELQHQPSQDGVEWLARLIEIQEQLRPKSEYEKTNPGTLGEFRPVVERARQSTVRIIIEGRQAALGTIVSSNGYLLTKSSEIDVEFVECHLHDNRRVQARYVRQFDDWDLVLLKMEVEDVVSVEWADAIPLPLGTFAVAAGRGQDPVSVGVISVLARDLSDKGKGFLGIQMGPSEAGVVVTMVLPGSAADKGGLQKGDVILRVDGREVSTVDNLKTTISGFAPQEAVTIDYLRGDEAAQTEVVLGDRESGLESAQTGPDIQDLTSRMGGDVSRRRGGFPMALQHDLVLDPSDCGGPLVGLDGKVFGLNIARVGRVQSLAIPSEKVREVLQTVDLSRPIYANMDLNELAAGVEASRAAVDEARDALLKAREQNRELRNLLRRARSMQDAGSDREGAIEASGLRY